MGLTDVQRKQVECLALAQAFDTFWAYYTQTDGALYDEQCRAAAQGFLSRVDELSRDDPRIVAGTEVGLSSDSEVAEIRDSLASWATGADDLPYPSKLQSRLMVFVLMAGIRGFLIKELELDGLPGSIMSSVEADYSAQVLRWRAHLPQKCLRGNPSALMEKASGGETIVIVGDVRRSQDLMTYATSGQDFSLRMVDLIRHTRGLADRFGGIFDKFTGDGFLVHFNEVLARELDTEPLASALSFVHELQDFSESHFAEWTRTVQKLPGINIGLALGGDAGPVEFHDVDDQLVAVGLPIVWASRMASGAKASEFLVNNLLWTKISGRFAGASGETRELATKGGESFLARAVDPAALLVPKTSS